LNALSDITKLNNENSVITSLEMWYEVLTKVMNLWTTASKPTKAVAQSRDKSDADDFYVILYNEEDNQQKFK
jgi:hypothetical protein